MPVATKRQPASAPPPMFPPVRLVSGSAFELVAELAAFTSGPARASLESGKRWIRDVRSLAGQDLIRRVEAWSFPVFASLAVEALSTAEPHDAQQLVTRVRSLPAATLRLRLLGADSPNSRAMVAADAFDRALRGDRAARAELRRELAPTPQARRAVDRLVSMPATEIRDDLAAILDDWAARVFPAFADEAMAIVRRDVAAKQQALRDSGPKAVLRAALNGVDLAEAPPHPELVVAPTLALRPFVAAVDTDAGMIYLCSVADESLDDDPAAPPRRLVKIAFAMGDPLRLRILRALGDDALTATEVAERLGVDRTTLHHHLGILRSAGLLSIRDEGVAGWRYSRRTDGVAEATRALETYLEH
jgi:DNA-binding transcriptional ArsR family regulator